jgi:hypothetical protein
MKVEVERSLVKRLGRDNRGKRQWKRPSALSMGQTTWETTSQKT